MKKVFLGFLLFLISFNCAFAQDGYLNFRWGMTQNEVSNLLDDDSRKSYKKGSYVSDPIMLMMEYFYGTEIRNSFDNRWRINPMFSYPNYSNTYENYQCKDIGNYQDGALSFFFENNKLMGVQTIFRQANILRELESRYGRGTDIVGYYAKVWFINNRFIIWIDNSSGNRITEFVTYFDPIPLRRICQNSIEANRAILREEQQKNRSRLD